MPWRSSLSLSCTRRARRDDATELDLATKAIFLLAWALLNFSGWPCCVAGGRRAAVAHNDYHAHPALAVQVRQADDDGEFRRPDDYRPGYVGVSLYDHAALARAILFAVAISVPVLVLLWRIDPFRVRMRTTALGSTLQAGSWRCRLPIRPTSMVNFSIETMCRNLRARVGGLRVCDARAAGIDATVAERLKARWRHAVHSKASAYHPAA
jgi:hypothetical protein